MKEKIEHYDDLSESERLAVDLFVEQNPEYRELLNRYKRLNWLLTQAREGVAPDDVARVTTSRLYSGRPPEDVQEEEERIREAIQADPGLQQLAAEYEDRLKDLDAASDPAAQFEVLRGQERSAPHQTPRNGSLAAGRDERPTRLWSKTSRLAIAAAIGATALVASVVVLERAHTSELDRAAAFTSDELDRGQYVFVVRSADQFNQLPADSLFLNALDVLRQADRSFLGFFRSYDAEDLHSARAALQRVVEMEGEATYLALEARYLLAKILIHQGRLGTAQRELEVVTEEGGSRADRARELLADLEGR